MPTYTPSRPVVANAFANQASGSPDIATPSYMDTGFPLISGVPVVPPRGYFNWLFNYAMNGIRYLCARAIADWDSTEIAYAPGSIVYNNDAYFWMLRGTATPGIRPDADVGNWSRLNMLERGNLDDYPRPIAAWTNYLGKRGHVIDHQGFLGGRVWSFDESWLGAVPNNVTARGAAAHFFGSWNVMLHGTNAGQSVFADGGGADSTLTQMPWGPLVRVHAGTGGSGTASAVLESAIPFFRMGSAAFSMAFDFSITNGIGSIDPSSSFAFGLSDGTVQFDTSDVGFNEAGGPKPVGVALYAKGVGNPWKRYLNTSGSPVADVPSAVNLADGAVHSVKFEIFGPNSSDNSTASIVVSIDNSVIANTAASLNGNTLFPFIRMSSAAVSDVSQICVGPLRVRARLSPNDDV